VLPVNSLEEVQLLDVIQTLDPDIRFVAKAAEEPEASF
jgi:hypothetical protein